MGKRYGEFISELFSLERSGMKPGIEGVKHLLSFVGNPEKTLRTIHVAGSNGKGSTAAILESMLRKQGLKTGLFTSPHLVDFRERIRVSGRVIAEERVEEFLAGCEARIKRGGNSFFEIATALAFDTFADEKVDIAVVEVGLGGRLDSTNVVDPLVSIVTTIGLEHTDILGGTLSEIAGEKAGIVRNHGALVTSLAVGAPYERLKRAAREKNAGFFPATKLLKPRVVSNSTEGVKFGATVEGSRNRFHLSLPGRHQVRNAACAIGAAGLLKKHGITVELDSMKRGLSEVVWPGRLDIRKMGRDVVFDVAHNPQAARALRAALGELFSGRRIQSVIGMLEDKDHVSYGRALLPAVHEVWVVEPDSGRALPAAELGKKFSGFGGTVHVEKSIPAALRNALAAGNGDEVLLVTGSFYVVGRAMKELGAGIPEAL